MSYADIAARGPKQSPEEVSVSSPRHNTNDCLPVKFSTSKFVVIDRAPHIPEVEHTDESVSSLVDVDSPHISSVPSDYESQSKLEEKAAAKKESAKNKARKNADNPVVLSNAIGFAVVASVLGVGAYRKYARGELTGKVVAAWAGVVGLFGIGDYYVSQYFFKRYPPKN
ncbi:hypothetical protein GQ44DRAFT_773758 [Phaeosphaeriaceae sp. PMI808]|nr:hypothetical protein GQ44DRAFT_773758 [Phaeosphaeriaceae sp. PMI808]